MKTFYKFKAHETKSITSAVMSLKRSTINVDENLGHAQLIIKNCNDTLLIEALNQITTVDAKIINNDLITNYSRYIYKLNPILKNNKIRLQLLRLLKPIGLFFIVRNINDTNKILSLTHPQYNSFLTKWNSIYGNMHFKCNVELNEFNRNIYDILIDENYKDIINYAIDEYVIDDTPERRVFKQKLKKDTFNKIDLLTTLS